MKLALLLILAGSALMFLGAPNVSALEVQASFFPYYEFTRNVAGTAAIVQQFLPLGVEAHDWEPSVPKVLSLQDTDVFIYNGLGLDEYAERLKDSGDLDTTFVRATDNLLLLPAATTLDELLEAVEAYESGERQAEQTADDMRQLLNNEALRLILEEYRAGETGTAEAVNRVQNPGDYTFKSNPTLEDIRVILLLMQNGTTPIEDGLEAIDELMHDMGHHDEEDHHDEDVHHDHGEFDPHVWLDPVLAQQQVRNIRDALVSADPSNAEQYINNTAAYVRQLQALHAEYYRELSGCGSHTIVDSIVTFHSAFDYLGDRYGFEVVSLAGLTSTDEVSTKDIIQLTDYIKENNIRYVLSEDVVDTSEAEVIAEETGAQVLTLSPIEGISAEQFQSGTTYMDVMRDNLETLKIALSCQ